MVTDRVIQIEIPVKKLSWIDKLLKRPDVRVFHVRRACLGALINFSGRTVGVEKIKNAEKVGLPELIKAIGSDGETMITCLGILIEDTCEEPSEEIKEFIRRNMDNSDMKAVLAFLMQHSRYEDFLSSTILIKGMSLMEPAEIIAPETKTFGAQSEEQ